MEVPMYSNKFVASIVVGGKIMREFSDGTVPIPFGSEYVIRLRNKNDRRAVAKIDVDGENVSGGGYILAAAGMPGSVVEIRRHADVDSAFKFVAAGSEESVAAGKSVTPEDDKGVVRVRFHLEKPGAQVPVPPPYRPDPYWKHYLGASNLAATMKKAILHPGTDHRAEGALSGHTPRRGPGGQSQSVGSFMPHTLREFEQEEKTSGAINVDWSATVSPPPAGTNALLDNQSQAMLNCVAVPPELFNLTVGDHPVTAACTDYQASPEELKAGVTVEGSATGQQFRLQPFDAEEQFATLFQRLKGFNPSRNVDFCHGCGSRRKSEHRFCGHCGTALPPAVMLG